MPDWVSMRLMEALIILITGQMTLAVSIMGPRRPRWSNLAPLLAALLVVAHLFLEGGRWQMAPAYCVVLALCAFGLVRWVYPSREAGRVVSVLARVGAGLGFLAIMTSAAATIFR